MPRTDKRPRPARFLAMLTGLALVVGPPSASAGIPSDAGKPASMEDQRGATRARAGNWFMLQRSESQRRMVGLDRAKPLSWTPDIKALSRSLKSAPNVPAGTTDRSGSAGFNVLTHIPFTRSEIPEPGESPYAVHGKLFLEYRNGLGLCSGTVVTSNNSSVIVTAAHCLVNPANGATPERVQFAPGYRLENAPFGLWEATAFGVTRQWAESVEDGESDPRYDVGAVVLGTNEDGQAVEDVVGSRGISFNQQPRRFFDAFGYPAVLPFDGERLWVCDSERSDLLDLFPNPRPHGIGCDMTPGSSGGGWVLPNGSLNSVNSFKLLDHPDIMYGPQFRTSAQKLYRVASDYDGTVTTHKMNLSIRLSGHLVVSGRMKADDGYALCARGAPIKVFRKKTPASTKETRWRIVDRTETSRHGEFRAELPDKRGKYYVESPSGAADLSNKCSAVKSARKGHRH